jgi:hypothetical protein
MKLPLSKARLGLAAAVLGGAGALAVVSGLGSTGAEPAATFQAASSNDDGPGDISGPCDEAEHANDPRCAGVSTGAPNATTPTTAGTPAAPTPASPAASGHRSLPTVGGTVTYTVDGGTLSVASAVPSSGWSAEVEQSSGREIEVDFRSGTRRVQVNIEFEDGQVRERVRVRDDANDAEIRIENGVVVRQEPGDDHGDDGDNSGPGSDNSGSGSSGSDNSGSGSGHDEDDDSSGSSGSGSSGEG